MYGPVKEKYRGIYSGGKSGLEPAILDWYGHCGDGQAMHKC